MSKYGFDPKELIETKIDLIDKDGFHGVGTADNRNSGNNFTKDSSWIIFYPEKTDNQPVVVCIIHLTKKDYPYVFEIADPWPLCSALYKGESIDFSSLTYNDEGGDIYHTANEKRIGVAFPSMDARFRGDNSVYYIGYIFYHNLADYENAGITEIPLTIPAEIEKGETVHLMLNYNAEASGTIQIDAPWTIDPSDFEE